MTPPFPPPDQYCTRLIVVCADQVNISCSIYPCVIVLIFFCCHSSEPIFFRMNVRAPPNCRAFHRLNVQLTLFLAVKHERNTSVESLKTTHSFRSYGPDGPKSECRIMMLDAKNPRIRLSLHPNSPRRKACFYVGYSVYDVYRISFASK